MVYSMKKAIAPKNKRIGSGKRQNPEVDMEAVKALRTVEDKEAFYFYEAIGKPTGQTARNLSGFLDSVKSAKSESLMFHLQRKDFQNWVEKSLGDAKLARKLGMITSSNGKDVRRSIYKAVENRIKELKEPSAMIMAVEDPVAPLC
jgi:predicted lactoylglutathione lyase